MIRQGMYLGFRNENYVGVQAMYIEVEWGGDV